LIVIIAAVFIVTTGILGVTRGVQGIANPVGDLVRQLVVEATPAILPSPAMIVQEIRSEPRLETTVYSFQDVLQIDRNRDLLWGAFGESLLFVAYGQVRAGIDMTQLQPSDLQVVNPTTVMVHLPDAEIFVIDLDNERSYVANRDVGFLARADAQLETMIRQEAESRMLEAALESGILAQADQEAERFISQFLNALGFTEVLFTDGPPPPVTPYVQEVPKGFVLTPVPPAAVTPAP
jgi:hypothetical protein